MPCRELPQELADAIIDIAAESNDTKTLKSLAGTAMRWSYRARMHLHKVARVTTATAATFHDILPYISHFIKTLHVNIGMESEQWEGPSLSALLSFWLPGLEELAITDSGYSVKSGPFWDFDELNIEHANLRTLRVAETTFSTLHQFCKLIRPFNQLESLHVEGVDVLSSAISRRVALTPPPLKNLSLHGPWSFFTSTLLQMFTGGWAMKSPLTDLLTLEAPYPTTEDAVSFENFMKSVAETVTGLTLNYYYENLGQYDESFYPQYNELGLSALSNLERLTMKTIPLRFDEAFLVSPVQLPVEWMSDVLEEVDGSDLSYLDIHWHVARSTHAEEVLPLDKILSVDKFPYLESLTYHIPSRAPFDSGSAPSSDLSKDFVSEVTTSIQNGLPKLCEEKIVHIIPSEDEVYADLYEGIQPSVTNFHNLLTSMVSGPPVHRELSYGLMALNF